MKLTCFQRWVKPGQGILFCSPCKQRTHIAETSSSSSGYALRLNCLSIIERFWCEKKEKRKTCAFTGADLTQLALKSCCRRGVNGVLWQPVPLLDGSWEECLLPKIFVAEGYFKLSAVASSLTCWCWSDALEVDFEFTVEDFPEHHQSWFLSRSTTLSFHNHFAAFACVNKGISLNYLFVSRKIWGIKRQNPANIQENLIIPL